MSGSLGEIQQAASARVAVKRAVFVVVPWAGRHISEEERDMLWNAFGVPIFELLTGRSGRVIAYECQAFAGLHLTKRAKVPAGSYELEASPCECGRPGDRILPERVRPASSAAD